MESVEWGEFLLGDLFEIKKTQGFNSIHLNSGSGFDYVTRTSQNQGVLRTTGIVENKKVNPSGVWSLGLLQMDFFFRNNPWYAGQFVRQITPKIEINPRIALFLTTFLNKKKDELLSVLVRDVDEKFRKTKVQLPVKDGSIDFNFMEDFVDEIRDIRRERMEEYLGLIEKGASSDISVLFQDIEWRSYEIRDLFEISRGNISNQKGLVKDESGISLIVQNDNDNGYAGKYDIGSNKSFKSGSIVVGRQTGVVYYQDEDFITTDGVLVLTRKNKTSEGKEAGLFLASALSNLTKSFNYNNTVSAEKLMKLVIKLPYRDDDIDIECMSKIVRSIWRSNSELCMNLISSKQ